MTYSPPTQPDPAPPPAPRLHFIDGLRALAVLLVLGTHYLYHAHAVCAFRVGGWRGDLFAPFQYGSAGVDLFLVLSGFCLYYPLVSVKNGAARREPTLWEFTRRRARRILPPYYASLILFTLWQYAKGRLPLHVSDVAAPPTPGDFVAHLAMLHTLRPQWVYGVNPVYWSLGLEWFLYIGFPIFVIAFRRFGLWRPVVAVTALAVVYQALIAGLLADDRDFFDTFLFARWPEFVLGMAAAKLVARGAFTGPRLGWLGLALASLGLMALAVEAPDAGLAARCHSLLWGAAFCLLLLAASVPHGALHRALSVRPLVWLGVISYSVYLTHFPLMHLLAAAVGGRLHGGPSFVAAWLFLFLPGAIGLGYLFHLLFERPFMGPPRPRTQVPSAPKAAPAPAALPAPVMAPALAAEGD